MAIRLRGVSVRLGTVVMIGLAALAGGCREQSYSSPTAAAPLPPPKIDLGPVACLATQWYPQDVQDDYENRLVREVVRQGVLMAAREELGLATRDETLGEPFPERRSPAPDDEKNTRFEPLMVSIDADEQGVREVRLYGAGAVRGNPVWRHEGTIPFNPRTVYSDLAAQMAAACPSIAEALRTAGASGAARDANPENSPPAEVERQLAEMNFVSQYGAVRAAHRAMAENGPSLGWMGVLVRGYAHLAMLTGHTWSSHTEAFAARSLLYAERMMLLDEGSEIAQWHRAYARALVGVHGAAIDQLESLRSPAAGEEAAANATSEAPAWTKLIEPFVKFDHDALQQVAVDHSELSETVALLQWNLYHSYMHGRWIYEKGLEAMRACPEAYGVYSVLANWPALVIKRVGASSGVAAFGERLPARVATLEELPADVRELAAGKNGDAAARVRRGPNDAPIKLAQMLMKATADEETASECSWAILASLIAEEQFVEAADLLKVSGDAVEYSRAPLVAMLEPLVEGHRYAGYIKSFAAPKHDTEQVAELLQEIAVVDPRPAMWPLFTKTWRTTMANGQIGSQLATQVIRRRNFTQPDLLAAWYDVAGNWQPARESGMRHKFAAAFRSISPHSPSALRMQWETAEAVEMQQLVEWEKELKNDPVGWLSIARAFYNLGHVEAAAERYQRSLDISPSYDATEGLAYCHYYSGRKDLWQSTLESYLQLEDLSLSHAKIHQRIAEENINDRKWKEAEPHALAAAQTYAAWGLTLASRVYEGLQEWDKAEYFVAEATQNYPSSSSGTEWYFFCRRTGRGKLDAAREFADRSIQLAAKRTYRDDADRTFVYGLLEDNAAEALPAFDRHIALCPDSEGTWEKVWRLLHTIIVAGETEDAERKQQSIAELRALAENVVQETDPDWVEVLNGLCRAFEGEKPDEEFLTRYYETISKGTPKARCNYCYFMGTALDQLGSAEEADLFWRRAAFGGPFNCYNATLAGERLAKRHGADRGGVPEDFVAAGAESAADEAALPDDGESRSDPSI